MALAHKNTVVFYKNLLTVGIIKLKCLSLIGFLIGDSMKLGDLEKLVLHYLWKNEVADVKQVHSHFEKIRGGSLNTYQSTLDRLYKKGLLSREKVGHAFQYKAKVERHELIGQLIKSITSDFVADDDSSLIAAFSSISKEFNVEQLSKLEMLIEEQKQKLKNES